MKKHAQIIVNVYASKDRWHAGTKMDFTGAHFRSPAIYHSICFEKNGPLTVLLWVHLNYHSYVASPFHSKITFNAKKIWESGRWHSGIMLSTHRKHHPKSSKACLINQIYMQLRNKHQLINNSTLAHKNATRLSHHRPSAPAICRKSPPSGSSINSPNWSPSSREKQLVRVCTYKRTKQVSIDSRQMLIMHKPDALIGFSRYIYIIYYIWRVSLLCEGSGWAGEACKETSKDSKSQDISAWYLGNSSNQVGIF